MIVCIPITTDEQVADGWGRAPRVALAELVGGRLAEWQELDVGWDVSHDEGSEGAHHARVARFLREHRVDTVATGRMGPGMERMMRSLHIQVLRNVRGEARAAAVRVGTELAAGQA